MNRYPFQYRGKTIISQTTVFLKDPKRPQAFQELIFVGIVCFVVDWKFIKLNHIDLAQDLF